MEVSIKTNLTLDFNDKNKEELKQSINQINNDIFEIGNSNGIESFDDLKLYGPAIKVDLSHICSLKCYNSSKIGVKITYRFDISNEEKYKRALTAMSNTFVYISNIRDKEYDVSLEAKVKPHLHRKLDKYRTEIKEYEINHMFIDNDIYEIDGFISYVEEMDTRSHMNLVSNVN